MTLHVHMMHITRNRATFDFNEYYSIVCSTYQCTNAPQWNSIGFGHFSPELLPDSPWKGPFKGLSKCFFMQLVFLHAEFGPSKGLIRGEKLSWIGRVLITSQKWWNILHVDFFFGKDTLKNHKSGGKKALHAGGVWVWPLRPRVAMLMANRNGGNEKSVRPAFKTSQHLHGSNLTYSTPVVGTST